MVITLDDPILGLENKWPELVYLALHLPTLKFVCLCWQGIHGVVAFETSSDAQLFLNGIGIPECEIRPFRFAEARGIAKGRPMPIQSLMLIPNGNPNIEPIIHYVR